MATTLEDVVKALGFKDGDQVVDSHAYGEVKSINTDGTYQVSLNGSDTTVKCARLTGAKVGDTVLVLILSNGYAVATGCVGGDTDALDALEKAETAEEVATNLNQYFWYQETGTDNGAHVTQVPQDDFIENPTGGNTLITSLGLAIRNGLRELATFTGNAITIGQKTKRRVNITPGATAFYDNDNAIVAEIGSRSTTLNPEAGEYYLRFINEVIDPGDTLTVPATYTDTTKQFSIQAFISIVSTGTVTEHIGTLTNNTYTTEIFDGITATYDPTNKTVTVSVPAEAGTYYDAITFEYLEYWCAGETVEVPIVTFGVPNGDDNGPYSVTEGVLSIAKGYGSHAEGIGTTTEEYAYGSHAEGVRTTANRGPLDGSIGVYDVGAHAEGVDTVAEGKGAHAQNIGTIAQGNEGQTAIGRYNIAGDEAFIIGNGTGSGAGRSNAYTVDWNGNTEQAGNAKVPIGKALLTEDATGYEYPLILDNSKNLWIGARQTATKHHTGGTYISSGHDGTTGNETIYISVPNANNNNATNYPVYHGGYKPTKTLRQTYSNVAITNRSGNGAYYSANLTRPSGIPASATILSVMVSGFSGASASFTPSLNGNALMLMSDISQTVTTAGLLFAYQV